jgi:hypothetical protein
MVTVYIPAELRRLVYRRAQGRCEYCLTPEIVGFSVHEYEHIIARKHGGATTADNLALSCTLCNQRKSSDLAAIDPKTGEIIRLFHPRRDLWDEHFQLNSAHIIPLTSIGRATANLLRLNMVGRIEERELLIELGFFEI